jgi:hypothetical protein
MNWLIVLLLLVVIVQLALVLGSMNRAAEDKARAERLARRRAA